MMARIELIQDRGFFLGGGAPFIDSPKRTIPVGFVCASAWSFEGSGNVTIRCLEGGEVLLCGEKSLELELRCSRTKFCMKDGFYSLALQAGQEMTLLSGCAVLAEHIQLKSPVGDRLLWCVVPCMGRLKNLKQTIPALASQKNCKYILVDWSCPEKCGDWAESEFPQVTVIRVTGKTYFNGGIARNAGLAVIPDGECVCFVDADVIAHPTFCERVLSKMTPNTFLTPGVGNKHLFGVIAAHRDDLTKVGGYDEVPYSWGHEDILLPTALELFGVKRSPIRLIPLMQHIDHDDTSRYCNFPGWKDGTLDLGLNHRYRLMRDAEIRRRGVMPSPEERRKMIESLVRKKAP